MKKELTIQGRTTDEKFASVEAALRRMSRKMTNKVIGILPVSPVFEFAYAPDPDGIIMRRLFPVSGTVTKAGIAFEEKGKKEVRLTFNVENKISLRSFSSTHLLKRSAETIKLDFKVLAGDMITVKVEALEGEVVSGIWIGMVFEINIGELNKKSYALEEFERLTNDEISYIADEEK